MCLVWFPCEIGFPTTRIRIAPSSLAARVGFGDLW